MASRSEVRTRQATRSTVASLTRNDLQNRNFLQPQGFRFQVARAPKVTFFGNSVNIPGLTLRTTTQTTRGLKDIDLPGEIIDFEDLTLRFLEMKIFKIIKKFKIGSGVLVSLRV